VRKTICHAASWELDGLAASRSVGGIAHTNQPPPIPYRKAGPSTALGRSLGPPSGALGRPRTTVVRIWFILRTILPLPGRYTGPTRAMLLCPDVSSYCAPVRCTRKGLLFALHLLSHILHALQSARPRPSSLLKARNPLLFNDAAEHSSPRPPHAYHGQLGPLTSLHHPASHSTGCERCSTSFFFALIPPPGCLPQTPSFRLAIDTTYPLPALACWSSEVLGRTLSTVLPRDKPSVATQLHLYSPYLSLTGTTRNSGLTTIQACRVTGQYAFCRIPHHAPCFHHLLHRRQILYRRRTLTAA
jgi:hypothetical protein